MGDRRPRVHLPILDTEPGPARASTRRWRFARWRAVTLILVYVLMTAHVVHWALTGRSVSRFVLSDSMRTLELGEINPGFLLFVASLLVTVIFGRFMCARPPAHSGH